MISQNAPDASQNSTQAVELRGEPIFDLPELLRMIRARQKIIVGTTLFIVALTAIYLLQLTPIYSATASVMLNDRQNTVMGGNSILSELSLDNSSVMNQVEILTSRNLMARVVDKLAMDGELPPPAPPPDGSFSIRAFIGKANPLNWFEPEPPVLSPEQMAIAERDGKIGWLLGGVSVAPRGASAAIDITFESEDPIEAAKIANAIAEAYVEDQLNAKFEASQTTNQWLATRLDELASQVQQAEAAVQIYRAESNITEISEGGTVIEAQLGQINSELLLARSTLAQEEAKYAQINTLRAAGSALDVSQVVDSPIILQLRTEQAALLREEAEFATRYGDRHPRMLDIQSEKTNLEEKIALEVERVIATVANGVAVARARVRSLEESLSQVTNQTQGEGRSRIRLRELEAAATSVRTLYESFLGRFDEMQGQQDLQVPDARVLSTAEVPGDASYPNKPRTLMLSIPAGFFLGFLLAFLVERLDSGFRTSVQLEQALGFPVLSTSPEATGGKGSISASDNIVDKPLSSFTEAVRGLQLGLDLSNIDRRPKVVLVTSSVPEEGKTTVAASLARLAACNGKRVVIVDADLRRPSVGSSLGIGSVKGGVVEALSGTMPLESCIITDARSGALVIPVFKKAPNPPELLGSVAMERFIAALRASYDLVIIDSAPLLPVNDTKILARLVDSVVFVVRWERTPRDAVKTAIRALKDVNAPLAGFVLSRADTKRFRYYSYGYQSNYRAYNKYYTD
jgi:succinoglycan biosynthesis transport protein ExoP